MRNRLLPLTLILILAGLLTLVLQEYTRQLILPLLFIFWVGGLLLETIPQVIIWGLFVTVALLFASRSLLRRSLLPPRSPRPAPPTEGRIETWTKLIRQANEETYYRWQLAQPLQELIVDVLAHHQRLTPKQIRQRVATNTLDAPPEVRAYLQASMTSFSHLLADRSRFRSRSHPSPLDLAPEKIVQFLEEKLDYHPD